MNVGQKVQCIDDVFPAPLAKHFVSLPVKGKTYTIRAIYPGRRVMYPNGLSGSDGEVGLLLQEITNPPDPKQVYGHELGFNSKRFRPLDTLPDEEAWNKKGEDKELVTVGPQVGKLGNFDKMVWPGIPGYTWPSVTPD